MTVKNTGPKRQAAKRPPTLDEAQARAAALAFKKALGRRLATLRHQAGMTQQEMAELTGVEAISRIERAARDPRLATLYRLSRGLRLSLGEVFDFDRLPTPRTHRADTDAIATYLDDKPPSKVARLMGIIELLFEDGP